MTTPLNPTALTIDEIENLFKLKDGGLSYGADNISATAITEGKSFGVHLQFCDDYNKLPSLPAAKLHIAGQTIVLQSPAKARAAYAALLMLGQALERRAGEDRGLPRHIIERERV